MSSFYTAFPISRELNTDDFLPLCIEWVSGIKGSLIPKSTLHELILNKNHAIAHEKESAESFYVNSYGSDINGIQYIIHDDDGRIWTTDIVAITSGTNPIISIHTHCKSDSFIKTVNTPKPPYIIKTILNKNLGGVDDFLPIRNEPYFISPSDIEQFSLILRGDEDIQLPIVYCSCIEKNKYDVNVKKLAFELGGLAHVVCEPNRAFSYQLRKALINSDTNIPTNGGINVIFPDHSGDISYKKKTGVKSIGNIIEEIKAVIISALSGKTHHPTCSMEYLKSRIHSEKLKAITLDSNAKTAEHDNTISALKKAIIEKDGEIIKSREEIEKLRKFITKMKEDNFKNYGIQLSRGAEEELYQDEFRHIIVTELHKSLQTHDAKNRRQHVLQSIITGNSEFNRIPPHIEEIKESISRMENMSQKDISQLRSCGFELTTENKHYKFAYMNDARYTLTMAKTPSDRRNAKNNAGDFTKLIFR